MRNPLRALFDTRSIGSSHELWAHLMRGVVSSAGTIVNENSAFNVPVILTCVSLISRTLMTLPVDVYERLPDGRKRKADKHPLTRLFDKPNGWQDWPTFCQMMQVHLLLRGNAYAWVNWVGVKDSEFQQAQEIIPIHPDRITVEQLDDWSLKYTLTRKNGQQVQIPADEIMHLRGLSTDGYMGRSPLQDWKETVGVAIATQEHAGNFWRRGGVPEMVLRHPKALSEKAATALEKKWEETYGGKDGRRVAVIEEGMEAQNLALPSDVSQFLETRKFARSELAGALHVPPHMIGDTEKQTSWGSGIEQLNIGYLMFTIGPWITVWEHGIKRALITNPQRFYVKFKVQGLMRADSAARSTFYERMWRMGVFTINDILALEDMDPIGDAGDVRYVPLNFVPLGTPVTDQARTAAMFDDLIQRLREAA